MREAIRLVTFLLVYSSTFRVRNLRDSVTKFESHQGQKFICHSSLSLPSLLRAETTGRLRKRDFTSRVISKKKFPGGIRASWSMNLLPPPVVIGSVACSVFAGLLRQVCSGEAN